MSNLCSTLSLGGQLPHLTIAKGDECDFSSDKEAAEGDKKGNNAQIAEK
jgi:hypothetical protein